MDALRRQIEQGDMAVGRLDVGCRNLSAEQSRLVGSLSLLQSFLTVMLILTFFSNTFMNYSLPEVATVYVQSGTITATDSGWV